MATCSIKSNVVNRNKKSNLTSTHGFPIKKTTTNPIQTDGLLYTDNMLLL